MALDRLVLIIVCVLAAIAGTVWLGTIALAALSVPYAWLALLPAALVGYIAWRVIAERVGNPEEDHYDRMDH